MHVVATAGHVDHGKSALVRALTGMEPDRWAEERRRGMTIDLGYAWTRLPSGPEVAFVDVPGHQRFLSNMLAGVGPVPAVLFVVAADEGWRRQSAEHLAAIDALGVRHGVLAITRSDLADPAPATVEARERIVESSLGAVEAVAVSAVTGAGLEALRAALDRLVAALPAPRGDGRVRLWVDRAFTIRGSGTVVTGTLGAGSLRVGGELELAPAGRLVRVRGLESLKRRAEQVPAVARVAVNLRGVDLGSVRRGDALVTPGGWRTSDQVDVRLHGDSPAELPRELVLHVGSAAVAVSVRSFGPDTARLRLGTRLPMQAGDRAILRDPGEQRVAAGVVVLDADPPPLRRGAGAARARALAEMTGRPDPAAELARRGAARRTELAALGVLPAQDPAPPEAVVVGDWLVDPGRWREWARRLAEAVDAHTRTHPLDHGLPLEAARRAAGIPDPRLLDALVATSNRPGRCDRLRTEDGRLRRPDAAPDFPPAARVALEQIRAWLTEHPFAALEQGELDRLGLTPPALAAAVAVGLLTRIAPGVHLLPGAEDEAVRRLAALPQPFTLSQARQALGTTRRVAVPLLERLDAARRTRRVDETFREVVRAATGP